VKVGISILEGRLIVGDFPGDEKLVKVMMPSKRGLELHSLNLGQDTGEIKH
jgi:hypothetical protein